MTDLNNEASRLSTDDAQLVDSQRCKSALVLEPSRWSRSNSRTACTWTVQGARAMAAYALGARAMADRSSVPTRRTNTLAVNSSPSPLSKHSQKLGSIAVGLKQC